MLVLNRTISHWLARYYTGPDHPGKLRLLNAFFNASSVRLQVPYAEKAWISLDPTDGLQASILHFGFYEKEVWDTLAGLARKSDVFWDIGANIGGVAIRAAVDDRIKAVHCFEPHPQIHKVLVNNIACNPDLPLHAHALALSDADERRTIYSDDNHNCGASSLSAERSSGRGFEIDCMTIDHVIEKGIAPAPTLVKIDTEGWEMSVLRGANGLFAKNPPRALIIEATADEKGDIGDEKMKDLMMGYGYRIEHVARPGGTIDPVENFLFTR